MRKYPILLTICVLVVFLQGCPFQSSPDSSTTSPPGCMKECVEEDGKKPSECVKECNIQTGVQTDVQNNILTDTDQDSVECIECEKCVSGIQQAPFYEIVGDGKKLVACKDCSEDEDCIEGYVCMQHECWEASVEEENRIPCPSGPEVTSECNEYECGCEEYECEGCKNGVMRIDVPLSPQCFCIECQASHHCNKGYDCKAYQCVPK